MHLNGAIQVVEILKEVKSTYSNAFDRLMADLEKARIEANEISKFLKPVTRFFEKLNLMDEFAGLASLFRPIFHSILLLWCHSKYYGSQRVVSLIREICNDLIMQVSKDFKRNAYSNVTAGLQVPAWGGINSNGGSRSCGEVKDGD